MTDQEKEGTFAFLSSMFRCLSGFPTWSETVPMRVVVHAEGVEGAERQRFAVVV